MKRNYGPDYEKILDAFDALEGIRRPGRLIDEDHRVEYRINPLVAGAVAAAFLSAAIVLASMYTGAMHLVRYFE